MSSINPIINVTLLIIIVLAIYTIIAPRIRKAIIFSAIMSVTAAFAYALLAAPDIALAEAVVGSTITTILFLVSIKKSKIFIVYYKSEDEGVRSDILRTIEQVLMENEYELQFVCTSETVEFLKENYSFELLINEKPDCIELYGEYSNLGFVDITRKIEATFTEENIVTKSIHDLGDIGGVL